MKKKEVVECYMLKISICTGSSKKFKTLEMTRDTNLPSSINLAKKGRRAKNP